LSKTLGGELAMLGVISDATTGDNLMAEHTSGNPNAVDRFVRLDDGDMHVVEEGKPDAPALLLIHGSAASLVCWDLVVPALAGTFRVIRVDLLGCGKSSTPAGRAGYDIATQAHRVGVVLDRIGVSSVSVVGHSSGCTVATALAEQRRGAVAGLALIDFGPSLVAKSPENLLFRLLLTPFPGRLLWRLRTEFTIRKAARAGFTRPVDLPDAFIQDALRMTYRAFVGTIRAPQNYLRERDLPDRLAGLGLPLLVIFGTEDERWPSSGAAAFSVVPGARIELLVGVGHLPIMEDPQATAELLLDFAEAAAHLS
jgi:pimeloyl-ACP methyl ester carboxylesterase